jgi:hypothetical protein
VVVRVVSPAGVIRYMACSPSPRWLFASTTPFGPQSDDRISLELQTRDRLLLSLCQPVGFGSPPRRVEPGGPVGIDLPRMGQDGFKVSAATSTRADPEWTTSDPSQSADRGHLLAASQRRLQPTPIDQIEQCRPPPRHRLRNVSAASGPSTGPQGTVQAANAPWIKGFESLSLAGLKTARRC